MPDGKEELRRFLAGGDTGDGLIARVLETLGPLFTAADEGVWPLADPGRLDASVLTDIYASALIRRIERFGPGGGKVPVTVTEVRGVSILSLSRYQADQRRIRGNIDLIGWGTSLSAQVYMAYGCEVRGDVYRQTDDAVTQALFVRLGDVRLGGEVIHERWPLVWSGIKDLLFFYVGLACSGNTDALERLQPAVERLHQVLPAGFRKDMPGNLALLAA